MTDRITFRCNSCNEPLVIDESNPPQDDDIYACNSCGHVFGPWREVRPALEDAAKAEIDRMTQDILGVKPTWTKR